MEEFFPCIESLLKVRLQEEMMKKREEGSTIPLGVILLLVVGFIIYLGYAQRILDRMHLTDRAALALILLIILGSFVDIPITARPQIMLNVGGALIPVGIVIYLLIKADTRREKVRGLLSALVTAVAIYLIAINYDFGHGHQDLIDPTYLFALVAGTIGYLSGRSRRSAFIAGVLGFILYNLFHVGRVISRGLPGPVMIGGAGALDTVIIAGILAVGIAELVGEIRERIHIEREELKGGDED